MNRLLISGLVLLAALAVSAEPQGKVIEREGQILCIDGFGDRKADVILLTHNRRNVVEAARRLAGKGTIVYAPEKSRHYLENAEQHWQQWWTERFDYYDQQVTKIPIKNFPATHYLKEGDTFEWQGIEFRFIELPGYTKDGGGYLLQNADGEKIVYTPNTILAGGKVPDLYSFQNAIPEAKIGNYHGYFGRGGDWVKSILKLKSERAKAIVPSRGAEIADPDSALDLALDRARQIYRNYLSTNALHWYFGEQRMSIAAAAVLGQDHGVKAMPVAEHIDLPEWCQHIGTTKLLISESKRGFIFDVGGRRQLEGLFKYLRSGEVTVFDGIFLTHAHNDHSAFVADACAEFGCPVYGVKEVVEVLSNPGAWHLPGNANKPVAGMITKLDGAKMKWEEFTLTFRFFPGQMYSHGAVLVEKEGEAPVFFIGDSFSPTGIDDYCLMNRNLLHDATGYLKCFDIVADLPEGSWLVNQHINHRFRFSDDQLNFLRTSYLKRRELIAAFVDWDDPGFGVDEQWVAAYPYGQLGNPGGAGKVRIRVRNHSSFERIFAVSIAGTPQIELQRDRVDIKIPAGTTGEVSFNLRFGEKLLEGTHILPVTVESEGVSQIEEVYCTELLIHRKR